MAVSTVTFDGVYTAEGEKNGKQWKRWDFKAGGDRYSTFQKKLADKITVGQPTTIEFEESSSNGYTNRTITAVVEENPQVTPDLDSLGLGFQGAPVGSKPSEGPDWDAIARGKVKSNLWVALLPVMFSSLPKTDQTVEAAQQLVDFAMGEVFPESDEVPF